MLSFRSQSIAAFAAGALVVVGVAAGASGLEPRTLSYLEAEPVIAAAGPLGPRDIVSLPSSDRLDAWSRWIAGRRAAVATRLMRGEEDSLVPLLLFGTSYTSAPRITRRFFEDAARAAPREGSAGTSVERALAGAFEPRVDDLLRALERPGGNERLLWARATLERLGHSLGTPEARARAGQYLVENFARVTRESGELSALLQRSGATDPSASRARVFAHRGLAPDTSWPVNFAVREALASLAASGELATGSLRRVALVGPGLDFVDKDEGFDYYPPQCLQPFAIVDALVSLGLAKAATIGVFTFDINPRVNEHLKRLKNRPASSPYELQLVRPTDVPWTPGATTYFTRFGAAVGRPVKPLEAPRQAASVDRRAVRISPDVPRRINPVEMDIVYQRLPLAESDRFDIVVATNVLLYYDAFEQGLASRSIHAMLAPGGWLITNTRLDDAPAFPLRRVRETTHVFSDRPGDGEIVYAYRR